MELLVVIAFLIGIYEGLSVIWGQRHRVVRKEKPSPIFFFLNW